MELEWQVLISCPRSIIQFDTISILEVKSFANAVFKTTPVPLSSIKSLTTS
jgi:hypothetical protein